ncbi:hypothetical protein [Neorhizobium galegae]|uniref:terminase small subunit-like protein n=1 Tax=Neorhizobium galegae TaxID=399 RepID=UPI003D7C35BD
MSGVSTFTEAAGDRICDRTAEGESFRIICRHEDMPVLSTLCPSGWLQRGVLGETPARAKLRRLVRRDAGHRKYANGRADDEGRQGRQLRRSHDRRMIDHWRLQVDAP